MFYNVIFPLSHLAPFLSLFPCVFCMSWFPLFLSFPRNPTCSSWQLFITAITAIRLHIVYKYPTTLMNFFNKLYNFVLKAFFPSIVNVINMGMKHFGWKHHKVPERGVDEQKYFYTFYLSLEFQSVIIH